MKSQIYTNDASEQLQQLPAESIHMAMTSPPYWNLRDYGVDGQLGLEDSAEDYVSNIADVMDEVKRVLRPDGSLWLNLGDTYDSKDLQQIPARVALELQNRGWILRNRVTWTKPNPMPQSVKDRLNDTTEAIFHFVKERDYWYDLDAIREPHAQSSKGRAKNAGGHGGWGAHDIDELSHGGLDKPISEQLSPAGKNPGDVFEVTTKPFPEAHFAVYPPELVEKPLKATCPPKVCAECGSPYEREVERTTYSGEYGIEDEEATKTREEALEEHKDNPDGYASAQGRNLGGRQYRKWKRNNPDEFKGWTPTCDCDTDATEAGIALDPFAGAGTTLLKAKELGRKFTGIELNPEYADMARARVGLDVEDPSNIRDDDGQEGLEAYTD